MEVVCVVCGKKFELSEEKVEEMEFEMLREEDMIDDVYEEYRMLNESEVCDEIRNNKE